MLLKPIALIRQNAFEFANNDAQLTDALGQIQTGEFTYVNAGHEIPYICRKGESFEAYKVRAGFVLAGMEDMRYKEGSVKLAEGDRIYLYTDGVPEATNADNEMYGSERLLKILNKHKDKTPENLLMEIKAMKKKFVSAMAIACFVTALTGCAKEKGAVKSPEELYTEAVRDAAFADEDEILPLVSLVEDDDMTTWKDGKVLLLTWHNYPDSYPEGENVTIGWGLCGLLPIRKSLPTVRSCRMRTIPKHG